MCGICGILNYNGQDTGEVIKKMTGMMAHRGPDDEGTWHNHIIALGQRRLSIIDLSEAGHQPMWTNDKRYVIVFNGEIYNFPELKKQLQNEGILFLSNTDTEVILYLYRKYKSDTPKHLNGIFAFAIYDTIDNELFVARDHFGVKPLYYFYRDGIFAFASEIKSLLQVPGFSPVLNLPALDSLLTFRHVPSPDTLFNGIFKLPPASGLLVKQNVDITIECYWDYTPQIQYKRTEKDTIDQLRLMYEEAVKRQMISDAPVGLSLSGGVDSGVLMALMSRFSGGPVKAFTVGFEDGERYNEIEKARQTAKMFGADFYPYMIGTNDYIDFFEKYIWHLEEPMGNESAAAYYFVAREAGKQVKVLLNGQGIDETMAGYDRYLAAAYGKYYRMIPAIVRNWIVKPLALQLKGREQLKRSVLSLGINDEKERLRHIYAILPGTLKNELYHPEFIKELKKKEDDYFSQYYQRTGHLSELEKMLYIDTRTSLPDNLLLCEDKMAMASSVEARVPFLDVPLAEFIETIPGSLKIKGLNGKYIHKKAVEKWLPSHKIYHKKIGFDIPMDLWLKTKLKPMFAGLTGHSSSVTRTYLNPGKVSQIYISHCLGDENHTRFLFLLLSIELWNKKFLLYE